MLGTETVRELRAQGVNSIICGFSANDMASQFSEAGADAFLIKPFSCQKDALELQLKKILFSREEERRSSGIFVSLSS